MNKIQEINIIINTLRSRNMIKFLFFIFCFTEITDSVFINNKARICNEIQLQHKLKEMSDSKQIESQSFKLLQPYVNKEMLVTELIPLMIRLIRYDNKEHTILERTLLAMRNMYLLTDISSLSIDDSSPFVKLSIDPELFHCQVQEITVIYSSITDHEAHHSIGDHITDDCYPLFAYHSKDHFPLYRWVGIKTRI
jgi:hypothetical protein